MVRVYHNLRFLEEPKDPIVPLNFVHVADVEILDKDYNEAFRLTNHIDKEWWRNFGVRPQGDYKKHRSTSVGDVVELESGKKFRCLPIGWSEII